MKGKILALFLLVLLFAAPAMAAVTTTVVVPANGTSYNNLTANIQTIPITFTVTDTNADMLDMNVDIRYFSTSQEIGRSEGTNILRDGNLLDFNANPTASGTCTGYWLTGATCIVHWTLPGEGSMAQGTYYLDVNASDRFGTNSERSNADGNATSTITINNRMANGDTIRSFLLLLASIAVIGVIIMALFSITMLNADPAKTAIMTVVAIIMIAIIAMIIGMIAVFI